MQVNFATPYLRVGQMALVRREDQGVVAADPEGLALEYQRVSGPADLIVDATGVGRPVVDLFQKRGLNPIAVMVRISLCRAQAMIAAGACSWPRPLSGMRMKQILPCDGRCSL